jgi:hypothetical protein
VKNMLTRANKNIEKEEQNPHWKKTLENPINKAIFDRLKDL